MKKIINNYISFTHRAIIRFTVLTSFLIIVLSLPHPAFAQNLSLSISPPILEVLIKPGKSITQVYKLVNEGDPIVITPMLAEYSAEGVLDRSDFIPEDWITIVSSGVSFKKPFILDKGMEKQIIVKISPPKEADEKEFYRALLFTTGTGPAQGASQSTVVEKIASILFVTVSSTGRLEKSAVVSGFQIPVIHDFTSPLAMKISVKNTGMKYFRPVGEISIRGITGNQTYKLTPLVILPGQSRQLIADLSSQNSPGVKGSTLLVSGLFIGKYEAEVVFTLDQSNIRVSKKVVFYGIPWKIILGLAFIILLFRIVFFKSTKPKK